MHVTRENEFPLFCRDKEWRLAGGGRGGGLMETLRNVASGLTILKRSERAGALATERFDGQTQK